MLTRRSLLQSAGAGAVIGSAGGFGALAQGLSLPAALPDGTRAEAKLEALPGKKPLIKLSYRPPNYEAPLEYFREPITPNDQFFVRYHLSDIPEVDPAAWRLSVGGDGANGELQLSLDELKALPAVEVVAINQCSGNRRGLFSPHVPGVEWGYGAMGCARWKGARLRDVLNKVGIKKETIEVGMNGTDKGASDKTPDFIKSIPIDKAMDESTLIAYEMNGAPLPHFNGAPARIVVPGWTGTYWVKHIDRIEALTKPQGGFWMATAYRLPTGKFPTARFVTQENPTNTPITEMVVNSLVTSHPEGAKIDFGYPINIGGLAWDNGAGIKTVDISLDDGKTWFAAKLGKDLGRYAFRPFSFIFSPKKRGAQAVMVRATSMNGQTQVPQLIFNPAGYHHNVIQKLTLNVA